MKVKKIVRKTEETELDIICSTLLSINEVEKVPLKLRVYDEWWWLRSPGHYQDCASTVRDVGSPYFVGYFVCSDDVCVRPALKISNLGSSGLEIGDVFVFGGKEFEIISEDIAFCLSDIGNHCFRYDFRADNANDYEASDVKRYVDEWFEKAKNEE